MHSILCLHMLYMWFTSSDIKILSPIYLSDLHGYILPHAGTAHSGNIISHTLRFRPKRNIRAIYILYIPVSQTPNVTTHKKSQKPGAQYHEFYVPRKSLQKVFPGVEIIGCNLRKVNTRNILSDIKHRRLLQNDTMVVASVDFSHHMPMQKAIKLENCAAHAIMHRNIYANLSCLRIVDHIKTIKVMYKILDVVVPDAMLQWIGRTRSSSSVTHGVGYLSFLIRETPIFSGNRHKRPDGFFVTAYDKNMTARECLGNTRYWSRDAEHKLVSDVIKKAKTTSRLTGGRYLGVPVSNYTITYLYKDKMPFIRGWHAMMSDALYLPDVFLENTYNNGQWIKPNDTSWKKGNQFHSAQTLRRLERKANVTRKKRKEKIKYINEFSTSVFHKKYNIFI